MGLDVLPQAAANGEMSYLLTDPRTRCCAVVDPVNATSEALCCAIRSNNLICEWVLSTAGPEEGAEAARAFSENFLCPRTAGPAGREGSNVETYDVVFCDDQRFTIGHVNGRAWVGDLCASYVFDGLIVAGCPVGAMATVGRVDTLQRLGDECCVMLHKPLNPAKPYAGFKSSLGELKELSVLFG